MTIIRALLAIGVVAISSPCRADEHHQFRPLVTNQGWHYGFWDAENVLPRGAEVETNVLDFVAPGNQIESGKLDRIAVSCRWRSYRILETQDLYSASEPSTKQAEEDSLSRFPLPRSVEEEAIRHICDPPPGVSLASSFPTVDGAKGYVQRMIVGAPPARPPLVISPQSSGHFAAVGTGPMRLAVVAEDQQSGNTAFIDWAHFRKWASIATVTTLHIIGPESHKTSLKGNLTVALLVSDFDCYHNAVQNSTAQTWDIDAVPMLASHSQELWRTVRDGSIEAVEMAQVCSGGPSGETYPDIDSAVRYARSEWNRRTTVSSAEH